MNEDIVSVSGFAEKMGVSARLIRDSIKNGKLSKCVVNVPNYTKPKIDLIIGEKEFKDSGIGLKKLQFNEEDFKVLDENEDKVSINSTIQEANRLQSVHKARVLALESGILSGKYVLKTEVYAELFSFGVELKSKMLAIPNRITDELISKSGNRNAFHSLLSKTIEDELSILSKYE